MISNISENFLETRRTARYFTAGNAESARHVVYLLHGYGHSAAQMLERLSPALPAAFVVAPEGLSRYYKEGYNGRVGASWMTKESREQEISDYIFYLDHLHRHLFPGQSPPVTILGFSQGASTAARWAALGKVQPQLLILWGGKLPPDLPDNAISKLLKNTALHYITGTEDQFVTPDVLSNEKERLEKLGVSFNLFNYETGHKFELKVLASFLEKNPLYG
ncbi:MAG: phospholipase [Bacteroidia bacterium]